MENVIEKIKEIMKERKIKQVDMCMELKIPPARLTYFLTVTKNIDIPIFKPVFADSYPFHITLKASATGISEVYCKP